MANEMVQAQPFDRLRVQPFDGPFDKLSEGVRSERSIGLRKAESPSDRTPLRAQQAPPAVAIPPVTATVLMGGYDPRDGTLRALNLDTLRQLQALVERLHCLDRLDDRQRVEAVIKAGAAVGGVATKELVVPEGEVWFLNRLSLVSPAESGAGVGDIVQVNVRVSRWPKTSADVEKAYWPADKGTTAADTFNIDFSSVGELGEELRLEAGDKLTLMATLTGAAAGADLTASLTPYGRKGKKLI